MKTKKVIKRLENVLQEMTKRTPEFSPKDFEAIEEAWEKLEEYREIKKEIKEGKLKRVEECTMIAPVPENAQEIEEEEDLDY